MTEDSLHSFLSTTSYFDVVPPSDLSGLLSAFELVEVPADTVLFQAGDPGDAWFLVISGAVTISGRRADGSVLEFATLEAGDGFGEIALLDDDTRSAAAVVSADAVLARLPREAFLTLLAERQPAAVVMLQTISTRLSQRLRELSWIIQNGSVSSFGSLNQRAVQTFLKTLLLEH